MSEVKQERQKAVLAERGSSLGDKAKNEDDRTRGSQSPELEDHDYEYDQLPVNPEIVQNLLLQLDSYKSMGRDGIHPRILKELAAVYAKPLLMIFEKCWESREVPAEWKLGKIVLIFKKGKKAPRNYSLLSLTLMPGEVMTKIFLEVLQNT
ncbi:RNA-directed DNA polymerase from mobile element jockey [Pitangus sulphuratus]|nr:RNA-directed DNA polymerase from mobile element jockey [Pitangus sulphuratus]